MEMQMQRQRLFLVTWRIRRRCWPRRISNRCVKDTHPVCGSFLFRFKFRSNVQFSDVFCFQAGASCCSDDILEKFKAGLVPPELINTSNRKKLAMRCSRACEHDNVKVDFPEVHKLFEGSLKDKRTLLRNFLSSGENLSKVEWQLQFERTVEDANEGTEELLTVDAMQRKGVHPILVAYLVLLYCVVIFRLGIYFLSVWRLPQCLGRRLKPSSGPSSLSWILSIQRSWKLPGTGWQQRTSVSGVTQVQQSCRDVRQWGLTATLLRLLRLLCLDRRSRRPALWMQPLCRLWFPVPWFNPSFFWFGVGRDVLVTWAS